MDDEELLKQLEAETPENPQVTDAAQPVANPSESPPAEPASQPAAEEKPTLSPGSLMSEPKYEPSAEDLAIQKQPTNAELIRQYMNPQKLSELAAKAQERPPLWYQLPAALLSGIKPLAPLVDVGTNAFMRGPQAAQAEYQNRVALADKYRLLDKEQADQARLAAEAERQKTTFEQGQENIARLKQSQNLLSLAKKISPESNFANDYEATQAIPQLKEMFTPLATQEHAKAMQALAAARLAEAQNKRKEGQTEKDDKLISGLASKMGEDLDPMRGRGGALMIEARKKNLAEHLRALTVEQDGTLKNLSSIPQEELSIGVANMLSGGGQAAQNVIRNVVPDTWRGDLAHITTYLSNTPQALNQPEFVKMFYDMAKRQGDISSGIIKRTLISRLPKHEVYKRLDPIGYNKILSANEIDPEKDIDESGRYREPGAQGQEEKVRMQGPDGSIYMVKKSDVQKAIAAKGKVVP